MEINRSSIAAMASIALGIGAATPLAAQQAAHDSHHANPPQLGNVQFQVDCRLAVPARGPIQCEGFFSISLMADQD